MPATPPPRPLRWLLWASLWMSLFPALFGVRYADAWWRVRAGKTIEAQRQSLLGVRWFKRNFLAMCERLRRTLPEDALLYVEPTDVLGDDGTILTSGEARWFLALNYYLYPIRVFVAEPDLASGTLVDYPRWLEHHAFEREQPAVRAREEAALRERGVEWKLTYPHSARLMPRRMHLFRWQDERWVWHDIAPLEGERAEGASGAADSEGEQEQDG